MNAAARTTILTLWAASAATAADFHVRVADPETWRPLLSAFGLSPTVERADFRILVGDSPEAREAGFMPRGRAVRVAALRDLRDPDLKIFWREPLDVPLFEAPAAARVFVEERRTGAPLAAGLNQTLWLAVGPGENGYERFPYIFQALVDLGLRPPFRGDRLWAFFDHAYRARADPNYLARRWRAAGIAALHVSAWQYHDADPAREEYLRRLIDACRREGVLVYAWFELPHVSDGFWAEHPDCRERTATLQDAQLDWRKLINLVEPRCRDAAAAGVTRLLKRFDWDGVNLAELYFESLHGPSDPARFTPMNDRVREEAAEALGFDPLELFDPNSERFWSRDPDSWRRFADFRADLVRRLQEHWLRLIRETLPEADLVVTQIEDRFDDRMRDYLGADAAALLPLAESLDFTLLIEDPATLWSLGPERYPKIAESYRPLAADPRRLAIDINIVERYQHAYPTRKQVGGELARLVHLAAGAFERLALYFEQSIAPADLDLLPRAASTARLIERDGETAAVQSERPFGLAWDGPAKVNGRPWPIADDETAWLPAGRNVVEPAARPVPGRVLRLNADLIEAGVDGEAIRFRYRSNSRALALLDRRPSRMSIDGTKRNPDLEQTKTHWTLRLPRGEHDVEIRFQP